MVHGYIPCIVPLSLWVNIATGDRINDSKDDSRATFLYLVKLLASSESPKFGTYNDTVLHILSLLFTFEIMQSGATYREVMRCVAMKCRSFLESGALSAIPRQGRCMTVLNALRK